MFDTDIMDNTIFAVKDFTWEVKEKLQVNEAFDLFNKKNKTKYKPFFNCGTKNLRKKICCLIKKYGYKNVGVIIYGTSMDVLRYSQHIPQCVPMTSGSATASYISRLSNFSYGLTENRNKIWVRTVIPESNNYDIVGVGNVPTIISEYSNAVGYAASEKNVVDLDEAIDLANKGWSTVMIGSFDQQTIGRLNEGAATPWVDPEGVKSIMTKYPEARVEKLDDRYVVEFTPRKTLQCQKPTLDAAGYVIQHDGTLGPSLQFNQWTQNSLRSLFFKKS